MDKIIMCIDMDAFFASVEQQANPKLRNRPIAVIGSSHRTVITTRSYEARKFGIKTGMNIYEARKLCPHLVLVVGDNEKYTHTCRELEKIYRDFTPDVEMYSIDEAFLDVTATHHLFGGAEEIGSRIKRIIRRQFGIGCTVGIAPNILMAKLASDMAKPDGLRWIQPEAVCDVLKDLPVKELWGIGPKITERLEQLGIRTCGEMGRAPASLLRNKFGILGETLKEMGEGRSARPLIVKEEDPKSIGHSMTLPADISDRSEVKMHILRLSDMVGRRARRYGFVGQTVSLTIRYADFDTFSKQMTLDGNTSSTHDIYRAGVQILETIRLRDKVRLIGVCLSSLVCESGQQQLFRQRQKDLTSAVDAINDRYGEFKVIWASCLRKSSPSTVISPAWRPSGVRHVQVRG